METQGRLFPSVSRFIMLILHTTRELADVQDGWYFSLQMAHLFAALSWWYHHMEIFSALLAICEWNPLVAFTAHLIASYHSWRRHHMELFFALLAICVRGIDWSVVDSPNKRPVVQSFDVSFDASLNTLLNKQSRGRWIEISWCLFDVIVMWNAANKPWLRNPGHTKNYDPNYMRILICCQLLLIRIAFSADSGRNWPTSKFHIDLTMSWALSRPYKQPAMVHWS